MYNPVGISKLSENNSEFLARYYELNKMIKKGSQIFRSDILEFVENLSEKNNQRAKNSIQTKKQSVTANDYATNNNNKSNLDDYRVTNLSDENVSRLMELFNDPVYFIKLMIELLNNFLNIL